LAHYDIWAGEMRRTYDLSTCTVVEHVMDNLKAWMSKRFDTPEKARTTLSNIAFGGGLLGFVLMVAGLIKAHAQ
jgi:hypothetical protein